MNQNSSPSREVGRAADASEALKRSQVTEVSSVARKSTKAKKVCLPLRDATFDLRPATLKQILL